MACYYPLKGFRSKKPTENGKYQITFNPNLGYLDMPMTVNCGQCIGCRLERSRQWAIRCVHEAQLHDENMFLTLTFDDEHLDPVGSLRKEDFQKFMKRLRKKIYPKKVKYFHCGEYGEKFARPHHHAIIFGYEFPDKEICKINHNGDHLYRSGMLDDLWPFGFAVIGNVTFESAAYVARYITKKQNGHKALDHYDTQFYDKKTGEVIRREPEYCTMSRRPAIAKDWYKKFGNEVHDYDEIILRDKKMRPPRYYDKLLEKERPLRYEQIKSQRKNIAERFTEDKTPARLQAREYLQKLRFKQLKRSYE